jgi:hypothetical protein
MHHLGQASAAASTISQVLASNTDPLAFSDEDRTALKEIVTAYTSSSAAAVQSLSVPDQG